MPVLQSHIDKALEIAIRFGATKVMLFGSVLEDMEKANDLDIAVLGIDDSKFLLFGGTLDVELGIPVDIVPLSINSPFVEYIKKRGRYIYDS